ncbi:MAG: exonuclease domain-containing protein [Thiolinea sp.]
MSGLFASWRSVAARQKALLKRVKHPVARRYLETPLPDKHCPVEKVQFLSLDFETTGLKSRSEAILSMGYTHLSAGRLIMRDSAHHVIRLNTRLPADSVVIHRITDDRMQTGMPLHSALDKLMNQMCGRVLLVHYAGIERDFLREAMQRVYGVVLPFLLVDTLQLEKRRLDRLQRPVAENQLRLANLRRQYRLPRYGAHNALEDAIATAELFLAELAQLQQRKPTIKLGDILC